MSIIVPVSLRVCTYCVLVGGTVCQWSVTARCLLAGSGGAGGERGGQRSLSHAKAGRPPRRSAGAHGLQMRHGVLGCKQPTVGALWRRAWMWASEYCPPTRPPACTCHSGILLSVGVCRDPRAALCTLTTNMRGRRQMTGTVPVARNATSSHGCVRRLPKSLGACMGRGGSLHLCVQTTAPRAHSGCGISCRCTVAAHAMRCWAVE
jgi:hypothetical protein